MRPAHRPTTHESRLPCSPGGPSRRHGVDASDACSFGASDERGDADFPFVRCSVCFGSPEARRENGLEPRADPTERRVPKPRRAGRRVHPGPRERLLTSEVEGLSDDELVAILLGTGVRAEPVTALATRLLAQHGGLAGLAQLSSSALARVHGVGVAKASRIVAAFELGRRSGSLGPPPSRIETPLDVDRLLRPRLAHLEVEHFVALALDARHRVTRELWIAKGTMTSCPVSVADVYRALVREAAPAVIFVHNHPSGEPLPSEDDVELTERLVAAGELLGLVVVDHVVIAREGFSSLRERGLLLRPRSPTNFQPGSAGRHRDRRERDGLDPSSRGR